LLALGFEQKAIEQAYATINEFDYGPTERYSLPEVELPDELVQQHGFLI